jgi:hypothetical protein
MISRRFITLLLAMFGAVLLPALIPALVRNRGGRPFPSTSHTPVPTKSGGKIWFDSTYRWASSKCSERFAYVYLYPEIDFGRRPISSDGSSIIEFDFWRA